jgi:hypothetical protein
MSEKLRPKYLTNSSPVPPGSVISFGAWCELRAGAFPESFKRRYPAEEMRARIVWDHDLELYGTIGEIELSQAVVACAKLWHKVSSDPNAPLRSVDEAECGLRATVEALVLFQESNRGDDVPVILEIRRQQVRGGPVSK